MAWLGYSNRGAINCLLIKLKLNKVDWYTFISIDKLPKTLKTLCFSLKIIKRMQLVAQLFVKNETRQMPRAFSSRILGK